MIPAPLFLWFWGTVCACGAAADLHSKFRGGDGSEGAAPIIFVLAWVFLTIVVVVRGLW